MMQTMLHLSLIPHFWTGSRPIRKFSFRCKFYPAGIQVFTANKRNKGAQKAQIIQTPIANIAGDLL